MTPKVWHIVASASDTMFAPRSVREMVQCMACPLAGSWRSGFRMGHRYLHNFAILSVHKLFAIQARLLPLLGLYRPSMHVCVSFSVKSSIV